MGTKFKLQIILHSLKTERSKTNGNFFLKWFQEEEFTVLSKKELAENQVHIEIRSKATIISDDKMRWNINISVLKKYQLSSALLFQ